MYTRYMRDFKFVDTEEEARAMRDNENAKATPYMRKHSPATYTPWDSNDGTEHKFVVWTNRKYR